MIVTVRDTLTGNTWTLTRDGDPMKCDEYVSIVRQWGVTMWPDGREGTEGTSGEFHLTDDEPEVEFIVNVHHEDE